MRTVLSGRSSSAAFECELSHGALRYPEAVKLIAPLAFGLSLAALGCTPGDGMRFQVMNMERPPEGLGLPPPADYQPCFTGEARGYDNNGDGKVDEIRVSAGGKERCYGEDHASRREDRYLGL